MNFKDELRYIGQDFKNLYLKIRFQFIRYLNPKRFKDINYSIPKGYQLVFQDIFNNEIDKTKWTQGPVWGAFHPDDIKKKRPNGQYLKDPESIEFSDEGLILKVIKKDTPVKMGCSVSMRLLRI